MLKPEQIEKIIQKVEIEKQPQVSDSEYERDKELVQAGYDFAIQSLAETKDEDMLKQVWQFLKDHYDDWDDSKCVDCHNTSDEGSYCDDGEISVDLIKSCPHMDKALDYHAKELLAKVLSIQKAKVMKLKNPWEKWTSPGLGYERCRQDILFGGK